MLPTPPMPKPGSANWPRPMRSSPSARHGCSTTGTATGGEATRASTTHSGKPARPWRLAVRTSTSRSSCGTSRPWREPAESSSTKPPSVARPAGGAARSACPIRNATPAGAPAGSARSRTSTSRTCCRSSRVRHASARRARSAGATASSRRSGGSAWSSHRACRTVRSSGSAATETTPAPGSIPGDLLVRVNVLPPPRDPRVVRYAAFVLLLVAVATLVLYVVR